MTTKKKTSTTASEESRALILIMLDNTKKRVEIPKNSKVTYGPALPMASKNSYGGLQDPTGVLRIYRSGTDVIAMFRNVKEFWEEGLKIVKQVRNVSSNNQSNNITRSDGSKVVQDFLTVTESFDVVEEQVFISAKEEEQPF